jgi:hypothetical protein
MTKPALLALPFLLNTRRSHSHRLTRTICLSRLILPLPRRQTVSMSVDSDQKQSPAPHKTSAAVTLWESRLKPALSSSLLPDIIHMIAEYSAPGTGTARFLRQRPPFTCPDPSVLLPRSVPFCSARSGAVVLLPIGFTGSHSARRRL